MIGALPTALEVDGVLCEIRTDYRVALTIFEAQNNPELSDEEKLAVMVKSLYKKEPENIAEAAVKAVWFLDGGDVPKGKQAPKRIMDWKQDEQLIFSALNKAAGCEIRAVKYLHWWTFLGYFREVGEGLFSQVINIRSKKARGKKLEKWEEEFCLENEELIRLRPNYSQAEQKRVESLKARIFRNDKR